jgi:hypothetical protein
VISTIYSVSSKLCKSSSSLIRRAGQTFPPQDEDQVGIMSSLILDLEVSFNLPFTERGPGRKNVGFVF